MPFELFQRVILTVDLPAEKLSIGDVGAVVDQHEIASVPEVGYSVEFFDMTGRTVAVVTVPSSSLREPTPADRPSVRVLANSDGP